MKAQRKDGSGEASDRSKEVTSVAKASFLVKILDPSSFPINSSNLVNGNEASQ